MLGVFASLGAESEGTESLPPVGIVVIKNPDIETKRTQGFVPLVVGKEDFYICTPLSGGNIRNNSQIGIEVEKGIFAWTELKKISSCCENEENSDSSPEVPPHAIAPLNFFPLANQLPTDESAEKVWRAIRQRAVYLHSQAMHSLEITSADQLVYVPRKRGNVQDLEFVKKSVQIDPTPQTLYDDEFFKYQYLEVKDVLPFSEYGSVFLGDASVEAKEENASWLGLGILNPNEHDGKSQVVLLPAATVQKLFEYKLSRIKYE